MIKGNLTYIIFFFFQALIGICDAQVPSAPNAFDSHNKRQGEWIILFDSDWERTLDSNKYSFYRQINFKDDLPIGLVTDYYKSGNLQMKSYLKTDFPEDILDGKCTYYYENGNIESIHFYKNNMEIDTAYYYDIKGNLSFKEKINSKESTDNLIVQTRNYIEKGKYEKVIENIKKLNDKVNKTESIFSEKLWDINIQLSRFHDKINDEITSMMHARSALTIADSIFQPENIKWYITYFEVAQQYTTRETNDSMQLGIDIYNEILSKYPHYDENLAILYNSLSMAYAAIFQFDLAIKSDFKAIEIMDSIAPSDKEKIWHLQKFSNEF